jgi:hypothetical protein
METNYKWIISAMDCRIHEETLQNVVLLVQWRLQATNGNYFTETYGCTRVPKPSPEDFTPYEELTKEQVVSWLIAILSVVPEPADGIIQQSELEKIEEGLNANLFLQMHPIEVTLPLPFEN